MKKARTFKVALKLSNGHSAEWSVTTRKPSEWLHGIRYSGIEIVRVIRHLGLCKGIHCGL